MERFTMPAGLVDEVLGALGVASPTDRAGVDDLYREWCGRVPFDPVAKAMALVEGRRPPGDDPTEVAERWLATGLGSTCWGHVAVLGAILERAGVACSVGLDRMLVDDLVDFHAFLVAHVDGVALALDPIHCSGDPLPIEPGATGTHPGYQVGFDEVDGRLEHWYAHPLATYRSGRYAVLGTDLDAADARAFLTVSIAHSGVGRRFFSRRTPVKHFEVIRPTEGGHGLTVLRAHDGDEEQLDVADLDDGLAELGATAAAVDLLVRADLLDLGPPPRWAT